MTEQTNRGAARLEQAFQSHKAFIPFITCGDPDLNTTAECIRSMVRAGADVIELGIPFSDPVAEGPVIQSASARALAGGVNPDKVFEMAGTLRREGITTPFVIMTYANVPYSYGLERFLNNCQKNGIDGLILPDLPFEEKEEFSIPCNQHDVCLISMIAPTSESRIARIAGDAKGFIYLVSSLGVTGTRSSIDTDLDSIIAKIRQNTDTPVAIGFGISSPDQAAAMAAKADGAIVGSAIVRLIGETEKDAPAAVEAFVKPMADAVHSLENQN